MLCSHSTAVSADSPCCWIGRPQPGLRVKSIDSQSQHPVHLPSSLIQWWSIRIQWWSVLVSSVQVSIYCRPSCHGQSTRILVQVMWLVCSIYKPLEYFASFLTSKVSRLYNVDCSDGGFGLLFGNCMVGFGGFFFFFFVNGRGEELKNGTIGNGENVWKMSFFKFHFILHMCSIVA